MREVRRADAAQPVVLDWDPVSLEPLDHLVHREGVPGEHDVRKQGVRAGDRLHLCDVRVNGEVETRRGRRLRAGDRVAFGEATVSIATSATPAA